MRSIMDEIKQTDKPSESACPRILSDFKQLILQKVSGSCGESLPEMLISVLIIALGLMAFATMIMTSRKIITDSSAQVKSYYAGRSLMEQSEVSPADGRTDVSSVDADIVIKDASDKIVRISGDTSAAAGTLSSGYAATFYYYTAANSSTPLFSYSKKTG